MLDGKRIVISGAAQGLGAAYAHACASEGAAVVVVDVNADAAEQVVSSIRSAGGQAVSVHADVSTWDACQRAVAAAVDSFGGIDGLVNNAGVNVNTVPTEETESQIRRLFEVNVYGTFFLSILASRAMLGSGSIVNVASGAHQGMRYSSVYGATKGAVASLTYCWANDLIAASSEIRVNAISPHARTPMFESGARFYQENHGVGLNLAGPDPETNSPLVVFLLSDESRGLTGQVIRIEGGTHISINTHPAILSPPCYRPSWTAREVAAAFRESLFDLQQPVGLQYVESRVVPPPTELAVFESN